MTAGQGRPPPRAQAPAIQSSLGLWLLLLPAGRREQPGQARPGGVAAGTAGSSAAGGNTHYQPDSWLLQQISAAASSSSREAGRSGGRRSSQAHHHPRARAAASSRRAAPRAAAGPPRPAARAGCRRTSTSQQLAGVGRAFPPPVRSCMEDACCLPPPPPPRPPARRRCVPVAARSRVPPRPDHGCRTATLVPPRGRNCAPPEARPIHSERISNAYSRSMCIPFMTSLAYKTARSRFEQPAASRRPGRHAARSLLFFTSFIPAIARFRLIRSTRHMRRLSCHQHDGRCCSASLSCAWFGAVCLAGRVVAAADPRPPGRPLQVG